MLTKPQAKKLAKELTERTATSYEPCAVIVEVEDTDIIVTPKVDGGSIHRVEEVVHFAEYHDLNVICTCNHSRGMHLRVF